MWICSRGCRDDWNLFQNRMLVLGSHIVVVVFVLFGMVVLRGVLCYGFALSLQVVYFDLLGFKYSI